MKKNNKTKSLTLEEIEAIPIEERTQEEWELLEQYFFETATPQERERAEKISKRIYEAMDYYFKKVREKEQVLKGKEAELKKRETKLETEKKKLEKNKGRLFLGGHLADQMLQKGTTRASDLFDILEEDTKLQLRKAKLELTEIIEGVNLTPFQDEIVLTLTKLRNESFKSVIPIESLPNVSLDKTVGFGNGNKKEDKEIAPVIIITPYEIAKELKGGVKPSGRDVDNTLKALKELGDTKYLMRETKRYTAKDKTWVQREIRGYRSLILVDEEIVSTGVGEETKTERRALAITLNPIFIRELAGKYVSYPNDIVKRTIEAYGSQRIPSLAYRLRNYLAREHSNKRYSPFISLENLFEIIAPKEMAREKTKIGRLKENTERALEMCKDIGLLKSYNYTTGGGGKIIITFNLHKEWK